LVLSLFCICIVFLTLCGTQGSQKKNPRLRQATNKEINVISEFIFAAANGNLTRVMYSLLPLILFIHFSSFIIVYTFYYYYY
jgi:hypothetical protein